jgi:preprotein translocase subunit YajC
MLVPMVLMFVMFYFLLIRPQSKARKEHDKLLSNLKTGDNIVTGSGMLGTVTNVKEKSVTVKVADNVRIEFLKSAIASVTKEGDAPKEVATK